MTPEVEMRMSIPEWTASPFEVGDDSVRAGPPDRTVHPRHSLRASRNGDRIAGFPWPWVEGISTQGTMVMLSARR
jgi:hypothetical protein